MIYYVIETAGDAIDQPTKRDAVALAKRVIRGRGRDWTGPAPRAIRVYKSGEEDREYVYGARFDSKTGKLWESQNSRTVAKMRL